MELPLNIGGTPTASERPCCLSETHGQAQGPRHRRWCRATHCSLQCIQWCHQLPGCVPPCGKPNLIASHPSLTDAYTTQSNSTADKLHHSQTLADGRTGTCTHPRLLNKLR